MRERRDRPLSASETKEYTTTSKVRAHIEHVFGAQENAPSGPLVHTTGIVCAKITMEPQKPAYNPPPRDPETSCRRMTGRVRRLRTNLSVGRQKSLMALTKPRPPPQTSRAMDRSLKA